MVEANKKVDMKPKKNLTTTHRTQPAVEKPIDWEDEFERDAKTGK